VASPERFRNADEFQALAPSTRAATATRLLQPEREASEIHKVSAQLEVTKPAPQLLNNNQ
jgi:hypothetical protein